MRRVLRFSFWGLLGLALAGALFSAMRPKPVLVDIETARIGPLQVTIDEDGLTRIRERYIVSTPLAGRLERITLEVGDSVVADKTMLAAMTPTDPEFLDPRALAQAQARVSAAQRRLDVARTEYAKATSAAEFAAAELSRANELRQSNSVSATEVEEKRLNDRLSKESQRAADFGVDIAEYELELQQAALLLTAPEKEDKSPGDSVQNELSIKAPINGRVLRIYQESSAVVQAGASIMEIGDPTDLEVVADVLSVDAVSISPGDSVKLENWGGALPLRGEVRIVEPSGFTKISALGVEEQRVNVIIDILDPPADRLTLGDGFRIDTRTVVWESADVLKVPTSALFRTQGQWQLFVVSNRVARQVSVDVGHNNGIEAEILDGLDAEAQVIVHPSDNVVDGVQVTSRGSQ